MLHLFSFIQFSIIDNHIKCNVKDLKIIVNRIKKVCIIYQLTK